MAKTQLETAREKYGRYQVDLLGMAHLGTLSRRFPLPGTCKIRGHRWIGTGWGGPDSGGDGDTCTRCGESWSVTFY